MNVEQLFARLGEQLDFVLPPGMRSMRQDIEQGLRTILQEALGKMDLVTRYEFGQQTALLNKTQLRVTELENRLRAMELKVRELRQQEPKQKK